MEEKAPDSVVQARWRKRNICRAERAGGRDLAGDWTGEVRARLARASEVATGRGADADAVHLRRCVYDEKAFGMRRGVV